MPYKLITAPTEEPVSLLEAKAHLRVDISDDDMLITALITAARQFAETECQRALCTQVWQLVLDAFPGPSLLGIPAGVAYSVPGHAIQLEHPPIQAIASIQYLDMGGSLQTMPNTDWKADLTSAPARITPRFGKIWPITLPEIGAVQVNFTAGYGAATDVPQGIKNWMLLRIGALYENREELIVAPKVTVAELPYVDRLLDPWRVVVM
ncbi:MAG TPA: head-tail connector protein [Rhodocyclaceae bacterium]|jgi:uncharacterized phiE125 gp8 family phage protein